MPAVGFQNLWDNHPINKDHESLVLGTPMSPVRYIRVCAFSVLALGVVWVLGHSLESRPLPKTSIVAESSRIARQAPSPFMLQQDAGLTSQVAHVLEYALQAESSGRRCTISYSNSTHAGKLMLDVLSPCGFLLDHRLKPQTASYEQPEGTMTVIAVAGGPPDAEGTMDPVLRIPCGTQVQGILLQHGSINASHQVFQGSTFCPGSGIDEKMYRMFSEQIRK